jgi:hypothetical protein
MSSLQFRVEIDLGGANQSTADISNHVATWQMASAQDGQETYVINGTVSLAAKISNKTGRLVHVLVITGYQHRDQDSALIFRRSVNSCVSRLKSAYMITDPVEIQYTTGFVEAVI